MAGRFVVPSIPVAEAKKSLPTYLDRARQHLLQIVTRHERDEVALVDLRDLRDLLRDHKFQTDVAIQPGEATVTLPQFRIIGIGESVDDATEDALAKLREYALQYLRRLEFYRHTDRRHLYPLVVRFLITPEDEQLRAPARTRGSWGRARPGLKRRTPGEILAFLKADGGWEPTRDMKHSHYEKAFADGTVLSTHVSFGKKKTIGPDTFRRILQTQLGVTEAEFWETIRLKKSQRTTVKLAEATKDPLTLALPRELSRRLHYTDEQMVGMTGTEAQRPLAACHGRR